MAKCAATTSKPKEAWPAERPKSGAARMDHLGESFLATSPIHGFNFISFSKDRKVHHFWLSLMLVFFVIMGANFAQLFYQWQNQKPVTIVDVNINEYMDMPPATICVVKFDDLDLIWNLYDTSNIRYPGTPLDELLAPVLNVSTKESFLKKLDEQNVTLQTVYYYFKMMSHWEHANGNELIDIKEERNTAIKNDDQWRAAELLEKFAMESGISRKQMFVKLGAELNKIYRLNVTMLRFVKEEFSEELIVYENGHPLSWVGEGELCFLIQLPHKLGDPNDRMDIFLSVRPDDLGNYRRNKPHNPIRISMAGNTKLRSLDDAQVNTHASYFYAVSTEITSIFETDKDCSTTKSHRWCQAECRQKLIAEHCGCRPFDFDIEYQRKYDEKLSKDLPMCWATEHFSKCTPYKGTEDRKCQIKECLPDCKVESQLIIKKGSSMIKEDHFYVDYVKFRLSVAKFIYPSFKQGTVMQWQNFIADFGGLFGLYFGASFLSIVHIGVCIFRQIIYRNEEKKNEELTVLRAANEQKC